MKTIEKRQVIPVAQRFFNDGAWYVLTSSSLGGSGLCAAKIVEKLQSDTKEDVTPLLEKGICLPLLFPGDCALDNAIVLVGDLTEQEEREWIGRIQSTLEIPCGEFLLLGGGGEEDAFADALENFTAPDPHFVYFQKFKLEPGSYLLEIYAFLGSINAHFALNKKKENLINWLGLTDVAQSQYPAWLSYFLNHNYIDMAEFGLQDYIIRLSPLQQKPTTPELDAEFNWCSAFEIRQPISCPHGILRSNYIG